jgi:hypothetical protein
MLAQNHDAALSAFEKSRKSSEIRQTADLITECRRNKALSEALARQVTAWARQKPTTPQPGAIQTGIIFTNDLVIRLTQGNVTEEEIVKMIRTEPNRFALGPGDLASLREAGVGDVVISAMQAKQ